jgi:transporter family protein
MKATLIALLAGLCWGVGEAFTKSVLHTGKIGPFTAMAVRTTVALPVIWITVLIAMRTMSRESEPANWLQAGTPTLLKLFFGSGLIAGAAGMLSFYVALSLGDISKVKPIAFATTVAVAVLLGWLVFQEAMPWTKVLAVMLIISGILLLMVK